MRRRLTGHSASVLPALHPPARTLCTTLRDWGFEYYRFDGEHALPLYIPGVDRSRLRDPHVDPIVAYRHRLSVIRETIGPETSTAAPPGRQRSRPAAERSPATEPGERG
jgi:hypothetical protein